VPPWLRACRINGSRFVADLPGATAAQPLASRKELDRSCSTKVACTDLPAWHIFHLPLAAHSSVGARGRRTLVVGDLACAILRRVLCHAGNDGGRKGRGRWVPLRCSPPSTWKAWCRRLRNQGDF